MSTQPKGLGRGLGALIPGPASIGDAPGTVHGAGQATGMMQVPVRDITP